MADGSRRYLESLRSFLDGAAAHNEIGSRVELDRDARVHAAQRRLREVAPQTLAQIATALEGSGYVVRAGVEDAPELPGVGITIVPADRPGGAGATILGLKNATLVFRVSDRGTIEGHVQVPDSSFTFWPGEWEPADFTAEECGEEAVRFVRALGVQPPKPVGTG
jgi:hypothetical protein